MSKSINQANISGNALVKYKIPVPSLPEQQKIVSEIEAIEKRINTNKEIIEAAAAKKKAVLDTWLK